MSYPTSQYQLEVSGSGGGVSFTDTDNLIFDVTHFAMFIQTDKAIYKPGQTGKVAHPSLKLLKVICSFMVYFSPNTPISLEKTSLKSENLFCTMSLVQAFFTFVEF